MIMAKDLRDNVGNKIANDMGKSLILERYDGTD